MLEAILEGKSYASPVRRHVRPEKPMFLPLSWAISISWCATRLGFSEISVKKRIVMLFVRKCFFSTLGAG
jgi:hypothetical protein